MASEIVMFDAVNVAQIPNGPVAVAGYTDGAWPTAAELAERFPNAHLLSIATSAGHDADCLDVESGDATPADVPGWYERQRARGVERPCIYADASTMQASIVPLVRSGAIARSLVRLWSAHYSGEHICAPSSCGAVSLDMDGTQWTDSAWGRDLDESLLAADFFGTAKPAPAKAKAVPVTTVPIEIQDDSVLIHATVGGQPVSFILDTGDAIGPVFTQADAARLGLVRGAPFGVEGAGGSSSAYQTTASITFDDVTFTDEPSAIDDDLQGNSLLGLPFFLAKAGTLTFSFTARTLSLVPLPAKA
jgi:gag-polyprotein putative aspartyl protease